MDRKIGWTLVLVLFAAGALIVWNLLHPAAPVEASKGSSFRQAGGVTPPRSNSPALRDSIDSTDSIESPHSPDSRTDRALVETLTQDIGTSQLRVVLAEIERRMKSPDRKAVEDAFVASLAAHRDRPDLMKILIDDMLQRELSIETNQAAAQVLMSITPTQALSRALGQFATRSSGEFRDTVKRLAIEHNLIETLAHLVDTVEDVERLGTSLKDTRLEGRARRALEIAYTSQPALQPAIRRALGY